MTYGPTGDSGTKPEEILCALVRCVPRVESRISAHGKADIAMSIANLVGTISLKSCSEWLPTSITDAQPQARRQSPPGPGFYRGRDTAMIAMSAVTHRVAVARADLPAPFTIGQTHPANR